MSSGGIILLPAAVVIAAGAAVVLAAGAAAYLAVYAAGRAADGALKVIGDAGERLECEAARRSEADMQALRWQAAIGDVVELNARIRLVTARAKKAGISAAIPAQLDLNGCRTDQAIAWSHQADALLRQVEQELETALAEHDWSEIAADLPAGAARPADARAVIARYQQVLANRRQPTTEKPVDREAIEAAVAGLDFDANEAERRLVLSDALAAGACVPSDRGQFLSQLLDDVVAANAAAGRRRLAATWLGALDTAAVAAVSRPTAHAATAERLRQVVEGEIDLDEDLKRDGRVAVGWAEDVTRQLFIRTMLRSCFADESYTVIRETIDENTAGLVIGHVDWNGEQSADVRVDRDGVVRAHLANDVVGSGDAAALRAQARCGDFADSLERIGARIGARVEVDRGYVPQTRADATRPDAIVVNRPKERAQD
jgi:hypothetical protein